jgi:hypothetical protein
MYISDMRIEWARARSRALRWNEEKRLLPEEMRRTIATHIGTRDRWLSRLNARSDVSMDISRGLDAYAHRQADTYYSLAVHFVTLWSPELRKNGITIDWPSELAEHAATVDALPERKCGRKKVKPVYMSDSESGDDVAKSIQFRDIDTESLAGGDSGEDAIELDGESTILHAGYTDSEDSEGSVSFLQ